METITFCLKAVFWGHCFDSNLHMTWDWAEQKGLHTGDGGGAPVGMRRAVEAALESMEPPFLSAQVSAPMKD